MSTVAIYAIVTVCKAAALSQCRSILAFNNYRPEYTRELCEQETAKFVDQWLVEHDPKSFVSSVRCGVHEERGA
jgi:hypothetical protein